jgi:hypothetical protein
MTNSESFTYPKDAQCELICDPTNVQSVIQLIPYSTMFLSTVSIAAVIHNFNSSTSSGKVAGTIVPLHNPSEGSHKAH